MKDLPQIFVDTLKTDCLSLFALAGVCAGRVLGYFRINTIVADFFNDLGGSEYVVLFIIVLFSCSSAPLWMQFLPWCCLYL